MDAKLIVNVHYALYGGVPTTLPVHPDQLSVGEIYIRLADSHNNTNKTTYRYGIEFFFIDTKSFGKLNWIEELLVSGLKQRFPTSSALVRVPLPGIMVGNARSFNTYPRFIHEQQDWRNI